MGEMQFTGTQEEWDALVNKNKEQQKKLIIEIMEADEKDGLYGLQKTQTAVEYLIEKLYTEYRFEFSGTIVNQAKQMEKDLIRNTLILFCNTESYGACDVKDWVKTNGVCFKPKDTDNQIKDRVDYFINNIVNQHK